MLDQYDAPPPLFALSPSPSGAKYCSFFLLSLRVSSESIADRLEYTLDEINLSEYEAHGEGATPVTSLELERVLTVDAAIKRVLDHLSARFWGGMSKTRSP